MPAIQPATAREVAEILQHSAANAKTIQIVGANSKHLMGGPNVVNPDVVIATTRLDRLIAYEPSDLTVSVEAGMPWRKFARALAEQKQMVPLDPIYAERATVGGVVASNCSGPRRRQFGTARDVVIGMTFATLNGRLVQSGGMVVKNVAGLDMAKLLIGSFGTLGVMTSINFKVIPIPPAERSFAVEFPSAAEALEARDTFIRGPIPPGAIDLLNPILGIDLGFRNWTLLLWFGGNQSLMDRCERELGAYASMKVLDQAIWQNIQNVTPRFLEKFEDGAVVRISSSLTELAGLVDSLMVPALSRAATGVTYAYFLRAHDAAKWIAQSADRGIQAVIEFASESARAQYDLWPSRGSDFAIMKKIKSLFDPGNLLNRGRLYGRI